jgi:hypothetical protein
VWQDRAAGAPVPWVRLVAALLLTTVTDALMRIMRALAHLVLLLYRIPVKRKVCIAASQSYCHSPSKLHDAYSVQLDNDVLTARVPHRS